MDVAISGRQEGASGRGGHGAGRGAGSGTRTAGRSTGTIEITASVGAAIATSDGVIMRIVQPPHARTAVEPPASS